MRKKKLLEELESAHHATDYWGGLVKGLMGENQKLLKENGDLRIENAILTERLRKNPPEDQEDLTAD